MLKSVKHQNEMILVEMNVLDTLNIINKIIMLFLSVMPLYKLINHELCRLPKLKLQTRKRNFYDYLFLIVATLKFSFSVTMLFFTTH